MATEEAEPTEIEVYRDPGESGLWGWRREATEDDPGQDVHGLTSERKARAHAKEHNEGTITVTVTRPDDSEES